MAVLQGDESVTGVVWFTQPESGGPVKINGEIKGLTTGKHGFHVSNAQIKSIKILPFCCINKNLFLTDFCLKNCCNFLNFIQTFLGSSIRRQNKRMH